MAYVQNAVTVAGRPASRGSAFFLAGWIGELDRNLAKGGVLRQLTARLDVAAAPEERVAARPQASADAPDFDERDSYRKFA